VGLPADLRFVSFNQSTTPVVEGVVQVVGADKEPVTSPPRATITWHKWV